MSNWLQDFYTEFVPICMNALGIGDPDPESVNVITTLQGVQHNFVSMLNDQAGKGWKFSLPGLIIDVGTFNAMPTELGMSVLDQMRAPVTVIYVSALGGVDTQVLCYQKILALKDQIEVIDPSYNTFTYVEQGQVLTSVNCPINKDLMADSQVSVICSALTYTPGFLVQLY